MRRLSEKTRDLLQRLHGDESYLRKFIWQQDFPLSIFDEIATEGEALAIPYLTTFLLNKQATVRHAAAQTIGRLVGTVMPTEFAQLDEACRNYWSYQSSESAWPHLKPAEVKKLGALTRASAVFGIASFHGSGFIREAAVNELALFNDGSELPFLLIRLNDWVEAVRESSTTAILQRIRPDYVRHFLKNLHLVFRLRSCGRNQHEAILARVTVLLQEPSAVPILREGILSNDRWLRRESFQMAIAKRSQAWTMLLREILEDTDPIMRLLAARHVFARLDEPELLPILLDLTRDRFATVRCEALSLLANRFPGESLGKLETALLDGSASVRATARYYIKAQKPELNFAELYRRSLNEPLATRQRAAILGLAETGNASDSKALLMKLDAPELSVQKAAIYALATLDGDNHLQRFLAALTNQHPGVSNEATRALAKRTNTIIDLIHMLFNNPAPAHVRTNLFKLTLNLPFWSRGIFLFEALRDRDDHIIEMGRRALQVWLKKSTNMAAPPSGSEVSELINALKASKGMLALHEHQEFEFLLRTWK